MLGCEYSRLSHNPVIQIERVTGANMEEALAVEMSISTFGIKKAFEETYHCPYFTYYLLRLDGKAYCTAIFCLKKSRVGRGCSNN